jgi:Domain of unknown function (DUF4136)
MKFCTSIFFLITVLNLHAQEIKVEYDKNRDFTKYKTFTFGEAEIITPKEERVFDEKILHSWVKNSITNELEEKGLKKSDTTADLIVSYIIGAVDLSETGDLGPFGGTPGIETDRHYTNSFRQGNLVIDLNDKSDFLVWRISAQAVNMSAQAERYIAEIVAKGFKKFSIKPKKSKKK